MNFQKNNASFTNEKATALLKVKNKNNSSERIKDVIVKTIIVLTNLI